LHAIRVLAAVCASQFVATMVDLEAICTDE